MDTFKGRYNEEVAKVCRENSCVFIIVLHTLINNSSNHWILPSINQQKDSSERNITYGILERLLDNLTKAKIQQMSKFR